MKSKINFWVPMIATILTAALYVRTASNRLTMSGYGNDGGDFMTAILTRGIPHPTGYPTYILLGQIFQKIPWGDAYFRGVLVSAIPAAMAAGLLAAFVQNRIARQEPGAWLAGLIAGFAWGVSPLLWSQAVIVEVHGLQALFIVLFLWWSSLFVEYSGGKGEKIWLSLLSVCVGISLGNHVTIVLMAPIALFALWRAWKNHVSSRFLALQIALVLSGSLVYFYLPLAARGYPPNNWGNPQTWQGFWWEISGQPYHSLLFQVPFSKIGDRILALAGFLKDQFGIVAILPAIIGAIHYLPRKPFFARSLAWIFIAYAIFAIGYGTDDSLDYLLPVSMVAEACLGLAALVFWDESFRRVPWGKALGVCLVILLLARAPATFRTIDPRLDTRLADDTERVLKTVPDRAIVFTSSDPDSFPLWYYHFGLKARPDVAVIVLPLTQFDWYQETLRHVYPDVVFPAENKTSDGDASWGEGVSSLNPDRPACYTQVAQQPQFQITVKCAGGK